MKPHMLFQIWRPDEVSECLEGVGTELSQKLWTFVEDYVGLPPELAEEPTPGVDSLASVWGQLTKDEQAQLNELARKHDDSLNWGVTSVPKGWSHVEAGTDEH